MDCPSIPILNGVEFRKRFFDKFRDKRTPFSGQMELTTHCNVRCSHCYIQDNRSRGETTLPEIRRFMDEIVDEGCLWLVLSGGEPLVRPDFLDIYTYGKKKGLFVVVFTNGTLLDERIADCFAELPPYTVDISFYGSTEATFDKVVGVPGSYQRCMKAIELLAERRICYQLKTVAVTHNQHEVGDIQRFARSLGVAFRYDPLISPRIDGGMGPCAARIPPEEVVAMDLADPSRVDAFQKLCEMTKGWPRSDFLFDCGAGRKVFHIDAHGRLQLCGLARRFSYDLRRGSFRDGWHNYFREALSTKREKASRCDDCGLTGLCSMCPAWTEMESGGEEGPIEYICQIAHLRARAFGSEGTSLRETGAVALRQ